MSSFYNNVFICNYNLYVTELQTEKEKINKQAFENF